MTPGSSSLSHTIITENQHLLGIHENKTARGHWQVPHLPDAQELTGTACRHRSSVVSLEIVQGGAYGPHQVPEMDS